MTEPDASSCFDIAAALARLPQSPGVYRMLDADGRLLYVGKAKRLRSRVRQYFQKNPDASPKTRALCERIHRFEAIVTASEVEALVLEDSLIKAHRPPFNILLRDDKRYPWLCITDEPFPRLIVTRRAKKSGKERYFGPYSNPGALYEALRVLRKHFPMRQRRKPLFKERPCMNYFIGACPGPCQSLVTPDAYAQTVAQAALFLKGRNQELLREIEAQMQAASDALNFERAARLRDRAQAVKAVMGYQQSVAFDDPALSIDAIGADSDERRCWAVVMRIREGRMIGSQTFELPLPFGASREEALSAFIRQRYAAVEDDDLPEELLLPAMPREWEDGEEALSQWLSDRRRAAGLSRARTRLLHPQKGPKRDLLALAERNAQEALQQAALLDAGRLRADPARALSALQHALHLPRYPQRMECYDISHVQGAYTVASMVVFTDGVSDRAEYRRFKIRLAEGKPDDFKSMAEVIRRRFARAASPDPGQSAWRAPDLVVIDGGKGQLHAAQEALIAHGFGDQPIISLAKRLEEVFTPGESQSVRLSHDDPALHLLQQIRDEAHRFAITYHRLLRQKGAKISLLETVPGLGPRRRERLIARYGALARMREASAADLAREGGMPLSVAEALLDALRAPQKPPPKAEKMG
ncbi:MAG: excinuclease ABC subunit UvrC [Vampirovibrionales bacterium]|nr:excinuclease ABC subunit UvrC [Vampirovibrionales bacterium]